MKFFKNHFENIIRSRSIRVKLFLMLFIFPPTIIYPQDEASFALKLNTFSTNPDLLGVLSNSVNLFTGQVNLPLNLVSLNSGNGLSMGFSIMYSSNIDKMVETRNLEAQTSALGVGWTMNISQIISDNKGTATREDDDFYLIENGKTNRLICTSINQNIRTFESRNYNNWLISYNTGSEKWTITKEDGTNYIFGDKNSGRMTVQYTVRWGNWIGNAAESGGQQQVFVWNLSQITDISGNYIQYTYYNVDEAVINNTAKHTAASYLKKITDSYNREIELYYSDKTSAEYQDPHTEVNEPDAYQERYEKEKLDSLYVKNSDGVKLLSIHFTSEVVTHNGIRKRFLTSIIEKNLDEESQVPLLFNYITTSNNYGALQDITIPTGGKVTYYYDSQQIEHSELNGIADAPSGYGEPRVFIHNNYVVITWRDINHSEDFRNAVVQAYEWDGKWIKVVDQPIGTVKLVNLYQDFSVTLQDDFFALMTATRESSTSRPLRLYAFSKDHTKKGIWNDTTLFTSDYNVIGQLTSGKNFIGIKYSQLDGAYIHDYVKIYGKIRDDWQVDNQIDIGIVGILGIGVPIFNFRTAISASDNFLLLFNGLASPDRINLYYYAGDNILKTAPQANLGIETSHDPSYLYSNNFSCLLFGADTSEYVYDWDENYNNFTQRSTIGPYPDYSTTYPTVSGYGVMKGDLWRSFFARRKGINWLQSSEGLHRQLGVAFGDDYFVYVQQGNYNITLRRFNANTSSFQDQNFNFSTYHNLRAGKDIFTANELIYNRQTNGPWTLNGSTLYVPSGGISNRTIRHGINFTVYSSSTGATINTYFIPVKNGNPLTQTELGGQKVWHYGDNAYAPIDKSELVGTNIIVTYSASVLDNQFRDVTSLNLYKVMDDQVTGNVAKYFVKGFKVNDGTNDTYTTIHYYPDNALIDPAGSVAQYNKVRVIPGGSVTNYDPDVHPYGYTDNYFFNGLAKNELALTFPDNDSGITNADDYYKLLTGNIYESRVYDANNNLKSSVKNYWYVYSKNINNDIGYYYRINKKERMGDGVTTAASYSYNSSNGQISQVVSGPILDSNLVTTTTYAFENNSAMQTANLLMQPYETRVAAASISQTSLTVSVSGMDSYDSKSFTPVITQTISIDFSYYNGSVMIGTTPGGNEIFSASGSGNGYGSDNRTVNAGTIYYVTALTEGSEFALLAPTNEANITVHFYPGRTISLQRTEYDAANNYLPYKTSIYDGASWVVTNTVTNRNSYGIPQESYDVNGSYSTIKYGYNDLLPVATIHNAKNSETAFSNFEDGTAGEWDTWTNGSSSTTAHTGEYGWYLVGSHYGHIAKSLQASQINTSGKYKVSGWVKSSSIFHPRLEWSIKFTDNSEIYLTPVYAKSTGDWEYIQSTIDLSSYSNITFIEAFALNGDQIYHDNCWWDDLLIAPVNSVSAAQTYDPVTLQITSKSDINGVPVFYQYDSFGRLTQTTNADSAVLSQTIYYLSREHNGGSFNPADPNYIQTKTYPDGASSTPLMVTTFTDGLGRTLQTHKRSNYNDIVSAVEYDDAGRQYRVYKPFSTSTLSYTTAYASEPYSEIIYYTDPLSRVQYTKPAGWTSSNEWTETKYGSAVISDASDPYDGILLSYTETYHRVGSNLGRTVVRTYTDKLGRAVRQESYIEGSQNKIVSITEYDMAGNVISETDPNGYVSTGSFSNYLNRLMESSNVDNGTVKYFYNQAGQLRFMKDAAGEAANPDITLYWKYDDLSRVIEKGYMNTDWSSVISHVEEQNYPSTPATWRKKYFYDDFSITSYAQGKLCKVQTNNDDDSAVEVEETFKYDKFGNTLSASSNAADYSADVFNALYSYDNLGRVTQIDYPLYKTVTSVHDLNVGSSSEYNASSPTTMTVGPSVTIQNGGTANLAAKDGITLSSGFSALSGSVFKASTNTYLVVKYTYNQLGQVNGVGNKTNNHYFANYYYNADGTVNQEKLNNLSSVTNYEYNNPRGFLTSISNGNFTENLAYSNTNTYYNGSIASASFTYGTGGPSNYSYTFQYDEYNRMTSAVNSASSAYNFTSIQYDDNGNLSSRLEGTDNVSFTYSGSNVPTEYTKNTSNYGLSHDENGNLTSISPYLTVSYDPFTMLTKGMSEHDIINTSYEYDGRKERILKNVNNGGNEETTLYLRGTNDYPLTEKTSSENQFYIYGPTGLISVIDDGTTYFVLKDHLGSTRVVLNSSNTPVTWYDYTPYGKTWRSTVNKDADYKFTGQELDAELGLYNFRARMYDPDIGIFYQSDPANQDFSPYMYVDGNPVIRVDKNGRWFWEIFQIVSTAYSIFQGFVKDGEVGALKNAIIAGVGGSLGQIGGGTFWENLGYGVAEGVITGGLSDVLWGGNGSGIWKGAIIGGGFATITSGIEAYRNFNDYGQFKTDSDLLTDLMSIGNNEEAAIYFAQKRYGFDDVSVSYDSKLSDYGITSPDGTIKLGYPALRSADDLKISLAHEWSHSKFDRLLDAKGNFVGWKSSASFETGPVNPTNGLKPASIYDAPSGYPAEVTLSGKLHISLSYMTRIDLATNGMLYYNVLSWHSMGIEKWWYWLPKR